MADQDQFMPGNGDGGGGGGSDGAVITISSTVMVAAVIFLFLVVVFVFLLYLYARRYLGPNQRRLSRTHFIFAEGLVPGPGRGLEASVLRSLPVTVYRAADFEEGLECAVCLSELADGEEARLLPKCNHGFHLECIDMWFHSHTTCPLCRSPVGPQTPAAPVPAEAEVPAQDSPSEVVLPEAPAFPTNVLFWGSLDQVNAGSAATPAVGAQGAGEGPSGSSGDSATRKPGGALVIDIPSRAAVETNASPLSPLPSSRFSTEEMKSPASSRFRSLTRLLSRGKRAAGPSYSPRGGDIEHGLGGHGGAMGEASALTPKTPTS